MKQKLLFILFSIFAFSVFNHAQTRTVTNFDLEKYKDRRIQAEKGLKQYYERQGVTEEDLARRELAENKVREGLSARLRNARLAEEWAQYDRDVQVRQAAMSQVNIVVGQQPHGYTGYYYYGNQWHRRPGSFGNGVRWRATPMGIIYEPGSRPSTIFGPPTTAPRGPAWRPARTPR